MPQLRLLHTAHFHSLLVPIILTEPDELCPETVRYTCLCNIPILSYNVAGVQWILSCHKAKKTCFQFLDLPLFFPVTLKFNLALKKKYLALKKKMKFNHMQPPLLATIFYWFCHFHCHIFRQYLSYWPKQTPFHYILRANNAFVVFLVKSGK